MLQVHVGKLCPSTTRYGAKRSKKIRRFGAERSKGPNWMARKKVNNTLCISSTRDIKLFLWFYLYFVNFCVSHHYFRINSKELHISPQLILVMVILKSFLLTKHLSKTKLKWITSNPLKNSFVRFYLTCLLGQRI